MIITKKHFNFFETMRYNPTQMEENNIKKIVKLSSNTIRIFYNKGVILDYVTE